MGANVMSVKEEPKSLGSVSAFPDQSVSCPICNQEFWGYSKIIFCSCGWTFVQEEAPKANIQTLRDPNFVEQYGSPVLKVRKGSTNDLKDPIVPAKRGKN